MKSIALPLFWAIGEFYLDGLSTGICDSEKAMLQFVTDLAYYPIQTSEKVYESIATLSNLAKSGEWSAIAETLSPELHQLVIKWDVLSAGEKGEVSRYAFGKHGTDILLSGETAKVLTKGTAAAKELSKIHKNFQTAKSSRKRLCKKTGF